MVHVSHLRDKIEEATDGEKVIQTVWGSATNRCEVNQLKKRNTPIEKETDHVDLRKSVSYLLKELNDCSFTY